MTQQSFPQRLGERIATLLPATASGSFCVAFSGGRDSTALLHAMALLVRESPQYRLRAFHVDHQLQATSAEWAAHCERECASLGVPFAAERVSPDPKYPEGVEAAARFVRYQALRRQLQPGETLLTAHHADDQLETLLLALVRGSGVSGLAAMPEIRSFGSGWHMRPMLECTREEVELWATETGLRWIDDPSNDSLRFDRNYLRREILPPLQKRWPAIARAAVRSASHIAEAHGLLDALAETDFKRAAVGRCLDMRIIKSLSPERRGNLLRHWLAMNGARMPSTRKLAALEHDILTAAADKLPRASWDNVVVRRHDELLYCERLHVTPDASSQISWPWSSPLSLPDKLGDLQAMSAQGRGLARDLLPVQLQVRFRQGGEKLQLPGRAHRSYLKNLLQEAQILPWWREHLPLIYSGRQLVAVADLWIAAEFATDDSSRAIAIVWQDRPQIHVQERVPG